MPHFVELEVLMFHANFKMIEHLVLKQTPLTFILGFTARQDHFIHCELDLSLDGRKLEISKKTI